MGKGLDSSSKPKKQMNIIKGFAVCLRARLPAVVSQKRGPVLVSASQQKSGELEDNGSAEGRQGGRSPSPARTVGTGGCGGSHSAEWGGNTQAP